MEHNRHWSSEDFSDMGWHDCRLYSMSFPDENLRLGFDIDYIFEWSMVSEFVVAPCTLQFEYVSDLKIHADFGMNMLIFISEIRRTGPRKSINGTLDLWDFEIECDNATLSFTSSGYEMFVREVPRISESLDLGRPYGHAY